MRTEMKCASVGSRGARRRTMRCSAARRGGWIRSTLLLIVAVGALLYWFRPGAAGPKYPVKCVVIGLDGLDPERVKRLMDAGKLPHLKALAGAGGFVPMATSNPPQSPVAWSSFATGMDPGGTAIFDFVHRDPAVYKGIESMATAKPATPIHVPLIGIDYEPAIEVGDYRLPLKADQMILNRKGTPFWTLLEKAGVPATILRLPANFPPPPGSARQLAGMGTPDLTGTEGAFFFWTDRNIDGADSESSGNLVVGDNLVIEDDRFTGKLYGPPNILLRDETQRGNFTEVEFEAAIDRQNRTLRIDLQDQTAVLREGEWSDWLTVTFTLHDWFPGNPTGMLRFRLNKLNPAPDKDGATIELYATPVQLDPLSPAMPITNPSGYSQELTEAIGRIYTLGMPEDNKAFAHKVKALDPQGFTEQCRQVLDDVWRTTDYELGRYRGGLFFSYFRTTDVVSHVMWYLADAAHPFHNPEEAQRFGGMIDEVYGWVDDKVGEIHRRIGDDALFIVMSDHGFKPFYREFQLNTWLADHGWLKLYDWVKPGSGVGFENDVDWERSRAYALGLNGLYLNLQGREQRGSVSPGEREKVAAELCQALEAIVDPETGEHVISKAYRREEIYHGEYVAEAPDIIVGYNRGYRSTGASGTGAISKPSEVTVGEKKVVNYARPRRNRWSGDHCCDPVHVPGVLIVNRPLSHGRPALTDLAPTILQEFGITKPSQMVGTPVVAARSKG